MNLANTITVVRLSLIPVFVVFACLYSGSISQESPNLLFRYLALAAFAVAACSDALDGFIARRFNQSTTIGKVLDPSADKLLLLSAVLVLSLTRWNPSLPIWFAILVTARDLLIAGFVVYLFYRNGSVQMKPILSSKLCTVFEFSAVIWALLDVWSTERPLILNILIYGAALLCFISGAQYFAEGKRQLYEAKNIPDREAL